MKGELNLPFLFYALATHDLAQLGADSAVPGLNRNQAYMSKQLVPAQGILDAFDSLVTAFKTRIYHASLESQALISIRNALLPKLISGEILVGDAEHFAAQLA